MRSVACDSRRFAYLLERFPTFTQTFIVREIAGLRRLGVIAPVFSIRRPEREPEQDYPAELIGSVTYAPASFHDLLSRRDDFRRRARRGIAELARKWGSEAEKRRIYEALWLEPQLREAGIRHVHAHFAGIAARTAFWLKRLAGIRYSFTAHANDIFCDEPKERLGLLIGTADCVVSVSDFSVRRLSQQFPEHAGKIRRVYNGIEVGKFQRERVAATPARILAIGRYIEKKGFSDLVEACIRLRDLDFRCEIIGEGPLEDALKTQVAVSGLAGKVTITGPRSESAIIDALAHSTLFVLPCVKDEKGGMDNLPTVIMEAMAAGVAVISTRLAGIPEMVIDGSNGWLVPERDPTALASALRQALANPTRTADMGEQGRAMCLEKFAIERTTAELRRALAETGACETPASAFLRFFRRMTRKKLK